jgi:hypothetical protein
VQAGRVDRTVSREYEELRGVRVPSKIRSRSIRFWSCSADCVAVPVRRSRTSRSVRRISLVAAGTGHRELETVRPRKAMRVAAWARATTRMDRVGEVPVVGKGRAAQTAIKKVGDGHFAREEVGADKTG